MPRMDGILEPFDDEAKTDPALGLVPELAVLVPVPEQEGLTINELAATETTNSRTGTRRRIE